MNENVGRDFNDNLSDTINVVNNAITINGHLEDIISENSKEVAIDRGNNQICIGCHRLIAALIGMSTEVDATDDLYFAVGNSDEAPNQSDESLKGPLFKHRIDIENGDKIEINGNILSVTANFYGAPGANDIDDDGNQVNVVNYNTEWRECGIYKGDKLLNRKIHAPIMKTSSVEIIRTFRFTF